MTLPCIIIDTQPLDISGQNFINICLALKDSVHLPRASDNPIEDLALGEAEELLEDAHKIARELKLPCEVNSDIHQLLDGRNKEKS